jgi:hypothetical protein
MKRSVLIQIIAAIAGPSLLVGAVYFATNNVLLKRARASEYVATFNEDNSPDLDASGNATVTDRRGIIWEYYNAADYNDGHVALNHEGYFGISKSSSYGLKGIEYITVDFDSTSGTELWLLKSVYENEWNEVIKLEDDTPTMLANNWQYIRFYNYAPDGTSSVDIDSVEIGYSCISTESVTDDVDSAVVSNIVAVNGTTAAEETSTISPRGDSQKGLKFTKNQGASETYAIIKLDRSYTLEEVRYSKFEFDYEKTNPWKPLIQLGYWDETSETPFTTIGIELKSTVAQYKSCYKITEIENSNWLHIEGFITAMAPTVCDPSRGDTPVDVNSVINCVKLGVGNAYVDNIRFDSTPSEELGIFNRGFDCNLNKTYWVKIAWSGVIHECSYTYGTAGIVEIFPNDKSPFYIKGLAVGSTTLTPRLVVGYNRHVIEYTESITTVNVK